MRGEVQTHFRGWGFEKMSCCDKSRAENKWRSCTNIAAIVRLHPSRLFAIPTPDILRVDECCSAPLTLQMEQIGRRTESMKPS